MRILEFKNVYICQTAIAGGPKEKKGPLMQYYDFFIDKLLGDEKSFEQSEMKMLKKTIDMVLQKGLLMPSDIMVAYGGDLINQDIISNFVLAKYPFPFVGVYGACSTSILSLLQASIYIDYSLDPGYALAFTSSHNATSERQFRNPNEYGGAKVVSTTSTVTGACACVISNLKSSVRVKGGMIGKVIDVGFKNMYDMGRAMAPAASETILEYLTLTKTKPSDYDLILTGDLSKLGNDVIQNILDKKYGYVDNYNDCGLMIYSLKEQQVFSGGSGCACCGIVTFGYVYQSLKLKKLKRVLIAATGALMNATTSLQKLTIPCISHIVELEAV